MSTKEQLCPQLLHETQLLIACRKQLFLPPEHQCIAYDVSEVYQHQLIPHHLRESK